MKRFFIIIFFLLCLNSFGQQYSKSWENINYVGDTMSYHHLDIYLPIDEKLVYPAIIVIYGSAWLSNSSKGVDMPTLGKALLDAGFEEKYYKKMIDFFKLKMNKN